MIEFHGWVVVRETYNEEGDSKTLLKKILSQLNDKLALLRSEVEDIEISLLSKNGVYQISLFGAANHKGYTWEQVLILIKWIAENAIGSYGLIYMLNDEDITNENENKFIVLCLKKGKISILEDQYFSPLVPEIED